MQIDKVYIDGCKRGEPGSQRVIYELLLPYLNALCSRYLNQKSDRQDILQDVFIKIYSKINQYDASKGAFHSWTAKILINACLQHNTKIKNRSESAISNEEYKIAVKATIIDKLTDEDLMRLLKKLPENYYQVFSLFVIDGFSHQEIAKILRIEESLSRQWLSRARTWLKKKLVANNEFQIQLKFSNN